MELDARFNEMVTNKVTSAASIYDDEVGTIEGVPMGDIGASIGESLEAIYMVSRVSKGLKGSLVARLRGAVNVVRCGTDEIQRRYTAQERENRGDGTSREEVANFRSKAVTAEKEMAEYRRTATAETETIKLRKELEEERLLRIYAVTERSAFSSPLTQSRGMGGEERPSLVVARDPTPLPQRTTRAKQKPADAVRRTYELELGANTEQVSTESLPAQLDWQRHDISQEYVTVDMFQQLMEKANARVERMLGEAFQLAGLQSPPPASVKPPN